MTNTSHTGHSTAPLSYATGRRMAQWSPTRTGLLALGALLLCGTIAHADTPRQPPLVSTHPLVVRTLAELTPLAPLARQDWRELLELPAEEARAHANALIQLADRLHARSLRFTDGAQLPLALLISLARAADDTQLHKDTIGILARELSIIRGQGWSTPLRLALRQYLSPPLPDSLRVLDERYLPPLMEALLDLHDAASLLRLADHFTHGPGTQSLQVVAAQVRNTPPGTIRAGRELPCTLWINEQRLAPGAEIALTPGTHHAACEGGAAHLNGPFTLGSGELLTLDRAPVAQQPRP